MNYPNNPPRPIQVWELNPPNSYYVYNKLYPFRHFDKSMLDENSTAEERKEAIIGQLKWRKLNSITVKNFNNDFIKKIEFNYNDGDQNAKRLNLLNIDEVDGYEVRNNLYTFDYDDFNAIPRPLSHKIDKWGYYTGEDYILPQTENWGSANVSRDYFNEHEASRNTRDIYNRKGLLKKIYYPTKGFTYFEYESNYARYFVDDNLTLQTFDQSKAIGGARISRIIRNGGSKNEQVETYEYKDGILLINPYYTHPDWNIGQGPNSTFYVFSTNNLIPLSNFSGGHISYPKVIKKQIGLGKTVYTYTSYLDYPDNSSSGTLHATHSIFHQRNDRSLLRGKLIREEVFNESGNMVLKNNYNYRDVAEVVQSNNFVKAFDYRKDMLCPSFGTIFGNAYKLFYLDYDLVKKETVAYHNNSNNVITESEFIKEDFDIETTADHEKLIKNGSRLLIETIHSDSDGFQNKIKYNYPHNFLLIESYQNYPLNDWYFRYKENIYKKMVDSYFISSPIEIINYKGSKTVDAEITNYKREGNKFLKTNSFKLEPLVNDYQYQSMGYPLGSSIINFDDDLQEKVRIDRYNAVGNILQITYQDSKVTSYIWGYNKSKIVAKVENVRYEDIENLSGFGDNFDLGNSGLSDSQISTLRNISTGRVMTYKYKPLVGVTEIQDFRGSSTFFEYDSFNRLNAIRNNEGELLEEFEYNFLNN
ncbi:hypothetical protein [Zunongwangia pacifica]|uniref:YD repeat-containing protein n=1 Tax=Zunongwangia pacifica TaxID=2911062 RepID=A0A9X2CPU9_9FLAO|nr:hypothetical protein [Zunongwangia pacifica]MCL6220604.1 hypothetical protein [Zunongwangia pacifica]